MEEGGGDVRVEPATAPSLQELFAAQYGPMVRLAYFLTRSNDIAEEIVQGAFLRLQPRFADVDRPVAYLRATVVNACRSHHRRRAVERAHPPDPIRTAVTAETNELLDAVLALPPRQRAVVVLRFYEDLSEAAIAETLGCRIGTVKSTLHKALAALRKTVEP